jgi:hypothetical protein
MSIIKMLTTPPKGAREWIFVASGLVVGLIVAHSTAQKCRKMGCNV